MNFKTKSSFLPSFSFDSNKLKNNKNNFSLFHDRYVFNVMQKTLTKSKDDERFNTFNVASHNAGVENIKNSLKFLESIFEKIQNHVQGNYNNLPELTV